MKVSLIEFSVENFKIFKSKATFSMASRKHEGKTFDSNGEDLLRTSLIFGPNASGKSTLLQGMGLMKGFILGSANSSEKARLPYAPFLFLDEKDKPSFFEIVFSIEKKIYRYNYSFLADKIVSENLFDETFESKTVNLLKRDFQNFVFAGELDAGSSKDVANEKTKEGVLFLSAASQWKIGLAESIVECFKYINIIDAAESNNYHSFTVNAFKENSSLKSQILNFLERADFSIVDGSVEARPVPVELKQFFSSSVKGIPDVVDTVKFTHKKFNSKNEVVGLETMNEGDESAGTQRFFRILGPIIDTLNKGKVLVIDEFDNSLHPELTRFIVNLFEKENIADAQLIATTHDTSLLGRKGQFLRSQVWFTQKDKIGEAELFSLEEFRESDLRNDTEFQRKYLEGRFGALPFINSIDV